MSSMMMVMSICVCTSFVLWEGGVKYGGRLAAAAASPETEGEDEEETDQSRRRRRRMEGPIFKEKWEGAFGSRK